LPRKGRTANVRVCSWIKGMTEMKWEELGERWRRGLMFVVTITAVCIVKALCK
jgi:hypothetical protein